MPAQKQKSESPQEKQIKVVFFCVAGQESSLTGMKTFREILKEKGCEGRFALEYAGTREIASSTMTKDVADENFRHRMEGIDFAVPMLKGFSEEVRKKLEAVGVKPMPEIIDVGFETIEDELYGKDKYLEILRRIEEKQGMHQRKPKT